jgi:ABC-type transport system involved in multi-copper enzyme maturation permease subunit
LGSSETAWPALFVSLGLIIASLIASWLAFERQEI